MLFVCVGPSLKIHITLFTKLYLIIKTERKDEADSCINMNVQIFSYSFVPQSIPMGSFFFCWFRSASVSRKTFHDCGRPVALPPIKGPLHTMTLGPDHSQKIMRLSTHIHDVIVFRSLILGVFRSQNYMFVEKSKRTLLATCQIAVTERGASLHNYFQCLPPINICRWRISCREVAR